MCDGTRDVIIFVIVAKNAQTTSVLVEKRVPIVCELIA